MSETIHTHTMRAAVVVVPDDARVYHTHEIADRKVRP